MTSPSSKKVILAALADGFAIVITKFTTSTFAEAQGLVGHRKARQMLV